MSKGTDTSAEDTNSTTVEDESLSTAQEAIPVPLGAGTFKVAGRFWSPILGQRAQENTSASTAKK